MREGREDSRVERMDLRLQADRIDAETVKKGLFDS